MILTDRPHSAGVQNAEVVVSSFTEMEQLWTINKIWIHTECCLLCDPEEIQ